MPPVRALVVAGDAEVTVAGAAFLRGRSRVTALDLAYLTKAGSSFLEGCSGLTTLDVTPLPPH